MRMKLWCLIVIEMLYALPVSATALPVSATVLPVSATVLSVSTAPIQRYQLTNGVIQAEITPDIGGRLLSFSLLNQPNFLKVGESVVSNPHPDISPESGAIGYLGHEVWVGPQSQWWSQQIVNGQRAAEKAGWPPDPYLVLTPHKILKKTATHWILQSPESPVSGVVLTKSYALKGKQKNSLALNVVAKNVRKESVAWDLWFNTRVSAGTQVYIPVISERDVRVKLYEDRIQNAFVPSIQQGIFTLDLWADDTRKNSGKVKLMIQPSAGWMAGFRDKQVFIVQFKHHAVAKIHSEQGQVELYFDYLANNIGDGLLEMEIHSPYKKLAAGAEMVAEELWTILAYDGENTREAQLNFLRKQAKILGLTRL